MTTIANGNIKSTIKVGGVLLMVSTWIKDNVIEEMIVTNINSLGVDMIHQGSELWQQIETELRGS